MTYTLMQNRALLPTLLALAISSTALHAQVPESAHNRNPWPAATEGSVKVFILAGQSNMQGHASLRTLEYLIYNEESAGDYEQWKDLFGGWTERRDVWISTTDGNRHGNLRPGFGENEMKIGPELGIGWVLGEQLDKQVLLIKTCWGGRSVRRDFLPPSAERPSEEQLQAELERDRKRDPEATMEDIVDGYGKAYRDMIARVEHVLGHLAEYFPAYEEERGCELAGLVWFQGWNDKVDGQQRDERYVNYTRRLATMIQDVRHDLNAPNMPVVIGELGVGGVRGEFQAAQRAVADLPELTGTVRFVETCEFWEPEVQEMCDADVWKGPDWVQYYNVGSQRAYHYLGSARIYDRMGRAMGEGMVELLEQ